MDPQDSDRDTLVQGSGRLAAAIEPGEGRIPSPSSGISAYFAGNAGTIGRFGTLYKANGEPDPRVIR
jgi:hypothetical protein